jgi:Acetyltransferase (GNAT) family.
MGTFITLNKENIEKEHICCAISDKKCSEGYQMKKEWLTTAFEDGHVFRRLDERAKVFMEYGPAEKAWIPVEAPHYLMIGCFWVSGQYKGHGYGKALLQAAIDDALAQGKDGLATVVGKSKFPFMGDTKWFLKHGFYSCASTESGFSLLVYKLKETSADPFFKEAAQKGLCPDNGGLTVYYSNRCPFTEFHVNKELPETAAKRNLPLDIIKLENKMQAQEAPTPATIFSLFYKGKFVTTDLSVCLDSSFDKIVRV